MRTRGLPHFVKLPSYWIENGGLSKFKWNSSGSDNLSALIALTAIAHNIDPETGVAHLTYNSLCEITSLSRAKVSAGLDKLEQRRIIEREPNGRSTFLLTSYNPSEGWAMLPVNGLYRNGVIDAFTEFRLRRRTELDAMKLYFLFASRRSRKTNLAQISYEKIEQYTGIHQNYIRPALTVLGANGLVHVERLPSDISEHGISNAYRLCHLYPRMHMGTIGRASDFFADLNN